MKPMLAATAAKIEDITLPTFASFKLDGVRCNLQDGNVLSRSLKEIPNVSIQERLREFAYSEGNYADGEITVGPPNDPKVYLNTVSAVMKKGGEPAFVFRMFDNFLRPDIPFEQRADYVKAIAEQANSSRFAQQGMEVVAHPQALIHTYQGLLEFEEVALALGYEGLILRHPRGKYKYGRSTLKENGMVKLKRFVDAEAKIIGVEELMHNDNEAFENELGHTARSTNSENLRPGGVLGALVVEDLDTGVTFKIGTGYDGGMRAVLWASREGLPGKIVKYKHFPIGAKTAPRHPVFLGFRHPTDMG